MKSSLQIAITTALLAASLTSCASAYILNSKPAPKPLQAIPFVAQSREKATIPTEAGISLHYDRTELVLYEDPQADGSVWLHYALVVKNANAAPVQVLAREVSLIAENVPTPTPIDQIPKDALNPDGTPYQGPGAVKEGASRMNDTIWSTQAAPEEAKTEEVKTEEPKPEEPAKPKEPPKKLILKTHKAAAIYRPEDGVTPQIPVAAKAYFRLPITFRIIPEVAKFYGNSETPLQLSVGFSNGKTLKLPLWLWRRK